MIYATMCIGDKWIQKHKESIIGFGKNNKLFVLTDNPNEFLECNTIQYERDIFSYYEKINLVLKLLLKYKERVTYIDADWIGSYDTNHNLDDNSLYVYNIFSLDEPPMIYYFDGDTKKYIEEISKTNIGDWYIPEAIISFPYLENINDIKEDFDNLQIPIENSSSVFYKEDSTKRYESVGIGYGEGWAITSVVIKHKLEVKTFEEFSTKTWRKIGLI